MKKTFRQNLANLAALPAEQQKEEARNLLDEFRPLLDSEEPSVWQFRRLGEFADQETGRREFYLPFAAQQQIIRLRYPDSRLIAQAVKGKAGDREFQNMGDLGYVVVMLWYKNASDEQPSVRLPYFRSVEKWEESVGGVEGENNYNAAVRLATRVVCDRMGISLPALTFEETEYVEVLMKTAGYWENDQEKPKKESPADECQQELARLREIEKTYNEQFRPMEKACRKLKAENDDLKQRVRSLQDMLSSREEQVALLQDMLEQAGAKPSVLRPIDLQETPEFLQEPSAVAPQSDDVALLEYGDDGAMWVSDRGPTRFSTPVIATLNEAMALAGQLFGRRDDCCVMSEILKELETEQTQSSASPKLFTKRVRELVLCSVDQLGSKVAKERIWPMATGLRWLYGQGKLPMIEPAAAV